MYGLTVRYLLMLFLIDGQNERLHVSSFGIIRLIAHCYHYLHALVTVTNNTAYSKPSDSRLCTALPSCFLVLLSLLSFLSFLLLVHCVLSFFYQFTRRSSLTQPHHKNDITCTTKSFFAKRKRANNKGSLFFV